MNHSRNREGSKAAQWATISSLSAAGMQFIGKKRIVQLSFPQVPLSSAPCSQTSLADICPHPGEPIPQTWKLPLLFGTELLTETQHIPRDIIFNLSQLEMNGLHFRVECVRGAILLQSPREKVSQAPLNSINQTAQVGDESAECSSER